MFRLQIGDPVKEGGHVRREVGPVDGIGLEVDQKDAAVARPRPRGCFVGPGRLYVGPDCPRDRPKQPVVLATSRTRVSTQSRSKAGEVVSSNVGRRTTAPCLLLFLEQLPHVYGSAHDGDDERECGPDRRARVAGGVLRVIHSVSPFVRVPAVDDPGPEAGCRSLAPVCVDVERQQPDKRGFGQLSSRLSPDGTTECHAYWTSTISEN